MATAVEGASSDLLVSKKLCRAEYSVLMVLDNNEMLHSYPQSDPKTKVICLSQIVRTVEDIKGGDRVALVVLSADRPIPWHEFLLESKYATFMARSDLVREALKILEADFTEILHSYMGMREYQQTVSKLTKAIKHAAKVLRQDCATPLAATFGVFVASLVHLLDAKPTTDTKKHELGRRSELGRVLFLEVVDKGVSDLKNKWEIAMMGTDAELREVFDFMSNNMNYEILFREWATVAKLQLNQNAASHPFSGLANHEEWQMAVDYFTNLMNS